LPPATLLSLARQLGFERTACEPKSAKALVAAQSWARTQDGGAVLATGSIYLVGELLAHARELGLHAGFDQIGAYEAQAPSVGKRESA
jgi:hypothetical protein